GLGPGRECFADAMAGRHRPPTLGGGDGETRGSEDLDHSVVDPYLLAVADRNVLGALRGSDVGTHLRVRSAARHLHSGDPRTVYWRQPPAVRVARPAAAPGRLVCASVA